MVTGNYFCQAEPGTDAGMEARRYFRNIRTIPDGRPCDTGRLGCYALFMAIYLCRWPNGEFSIVNAKSKADAIERLDEWGNAE